MFIGGFGHADLGQWSRGVGHDSSASRRGLHQTNACLACLHRDQATDQWMNLTALDNDRHGTVRMPYADTPLPTVHPADIASVARVALTEPGHRGRTYALTGPEPVTARQQVEAVAAELGRDVPFVEVSRQEAYAGMAAVFGDEAADAVLDVMGGDVNDELLRVRDTVSRVTGAPARLFAQWAGDNADSFR